MVRCDGCGCQGDDLFLKVIPGRTGLFCPVCIARSEAAGAESERARALKEYWENRKHAEKQPQFDEGEARLLTVHAISMLGEIKEILDVADENSDTAEENVEALDKRLNDAIKVINKNTMKFREQNDRLIVSIKELLREVQSLKFRIKVLEKRLPGERLRSTR